MSTDAEDLIARLSNGLHRADQAAFRHDAEAAINAPGECWGEGLIHRTIVAIWRRYFHPPEVSEDDRHRPLFTSWDSRRRHTSKLVKAPALEPDGRHDRRPSRREQLENERATRALV